LIVVIVHCNYYSQFYNPLFYWYSNRLLPLIRQFFLIPNRTDELESYFMGNVNSTANPAI
jgi:hypothetical protein